MQETARGLRGVPEAISEAVLAIAFAPATPPLAGWSASAEEVADSPVPLPELIAVIFPGTGDALALELSGGLLAERGGLYKLLRASPCELIGVAGIGEARAASLLAAAELLKRGWSRSRDT